MKVAGKVWLIRLTRLGKRALDGALPLTEQGTFEGHVRDEDEHGIWTIPIEYGEPAGQRSGLTTLLKWEYIATLQAVE